MLAKLPLSLSLRAWLDVLIRAKVVGEEEVKNELHLDYF